MRIIGIEALLRAVPRTQGSRPGPGDEGGRQVRLPPSNLNRSSPRAGRYNDRNQLRYGTPINKRPERKTTPKMAPKRKKSRRLM